MLSHSAYAQDASPLPYICDLYLENKLETYKPDENYQITIKTTSTDCLKKPDYLVLAYPQNIDDNHDQYQNYLWGKFKRVNDPYVIIANLNLANNPIVKNNPGAWIIKLCSADSPKKCTDKNTVLGIINIDVSSPLPTPTPIGLATIDLKKQKACTFQPGDAVELVVDNLVANFQNESDPYQGYVGLLDEKNIFFNRLKKTGEETIFSLGNSDTDKLSGKHKLCILRSSHGGFLQIDLENENKNCIILNFTNDPEQLTNPSCSQDNAVNNLVLTPTSPPPLPPCAQWVYAFDKNDKDDQKKEHFGDNGKLIDEQLPIYNDPNFTNRKCAEISTGLGNLQTDPFGLVKSIMSVMLGFTGGIAAIFIIIGGYKLMASQGNPEAIQAAREQITSAIIGLLFIIFSLVILEVIGVDILRIPGFTK